MFFTVWTYQSYVVHSMDPSILCLQYGPINLMLLTVWTHQSCLHYEPINRMLLTVWTHQSYVVYSMDTLSLWYLQYGSIKLMVLTVWTHQTDVYYSMDRSNLHWLHEFTKRILSGSCTGQIFAVYSMHN